MEIIHPGGDGGGRWRMGQSNRTLVQETTVWIPCKILKISIDILWRESLITSLGSHVTGLSLGSAVGR